MLNQALVVARKEVVDGLRDFRSLVSSVLYALMGSSSRSMARVPVRILLSRPAAMLDSGSHNRSRQEAFFTLAQKGGAWNRPAGRVAP